MNRVVNTRLHFRSWRKRIIHHSFFAPTANASTTSRKRRRIIHQDPRYLLRLVKYSPSRLREPSALTAVHEPTFARQHGALFAEYFTIGAANPVKYSPANFAATSPR